LHVESWHESIDKIRKINPARIYLPHFGLVDNDIPAYLDALDERVTRWSEWLRDKTKGGTAEQQLKTEFAKYEHDDLRAGGASEDDAQGYEAADPSHMAVTASMRYWQKYHPEGAPKIAN
jgi:hypothetical protein